MEMTEQNRELSLQNELTMLDSDPLKCKFQEALLFLQLNSKPYSFLYSWL